MGIDVHTNALHLSRGKPGSDLYDESMPDSATPFALIHIDPLQFTITMEPACSMSGHEAYDVPFLYSDKGGTIR